MNSIDSTDMTTRERLEAIRFELYGGQKPNETVLDVIADCLEGILDRLVEFETHGHTVI